MSDPVGKIQLGTLDKQPDEHASVDKQGLSSFMVGISYQPIDSWIDSGTYRVYRIRGYSQDTLSSAPLGERKGIHPRQNNNHI